MQTHKLARQKKELREKNKEFIPSQIKTKIRNLSTKERLNRNEIILAYQADYEQMEQQLKQQIKIDKEKDYLVHTCESSDRQNIIENYYIELINCFTNLWDIAHRPRPTSTQYSLIVAKYLRKEAIEKAVIIRQIRGPEIFKAHDFYEVHPFTMLPGIFKANDFYIVHRLTKEEVNYHDKHFVNIDYVQLYKTLLERSNRPGFLQKLIFYPEEHYKPIEPKS